MANLEEMSLNARRDRQIYLQITYGVLFFIYSLLLIFLFDSQQDQIVFDGGYAYYFAIYFLLPHHMAYAISLIGHLLSAQGQWLLTIILSLLADAFAAVDLAYASYLVLSQPHSLTPLVLAAMLIPLLLFILALIFSLKKKYQLYIRPRIRS